MSVGIFEVERLSVASAANHAETGDTLFSVNSIYYTPIPQHKEQVEAGQETDVDNMTSEIVSAVEDTADLNLLSQSFEITADEACFATRAVRFYRDTAPDLEIEDQDRLDEAQQFIWTTLTGTLKPNAAGAAANFRRVRQAVAYFMVHNTEADADLTSHLAANILFRHIVIGGQVITRQNAPEFGGRYKPDEREDDPVDRFLRDPRIKHRERTRMRVEIADQHNPLFRPEGYDGRNDLGPSWNQRHGVLPVRYVSMDE